MLKDSMEFKANVVREYSSVAHVDDLGEHDCRMELYIHDGEQTGGIEWVVGYGTDEESVVEIGLWFEVRRLVDYDGVFSLPIEAVQLLRKNGYIVPRDCYA